MAGGAGRRKEAFKVSFPKLVKMSKERFKRMSEGFLKEVIEKFGTAVEVSIASTAKKAAVVASAWALLSAARKGLLEKDYSRAIFAGILKCMKIPYSWLCTRAPVPKSRGATAIYFGK
jgi:hypothetical protein